MKKTILAIVFLAILFIIPGIIHAQYYGCSYHTSQRCSGSNLYWYDSCGNQQEVAQYCTYGCYNNSCQNSYNYNNYYNYGSCTYHAYRDCIGNTVYWYSGCQQQQDLIQNCALSNQVCQYGQCVNYIAPIVPSQPIQPAYQAHYKTACYNNSVHWFDSLGVESGLYQSCADSNSCTLDACSNAKCSNTLKCDGSTCTSDSADYNTYCLPTQPSQPTQTNQNTQSAPVLMVSFFAKQDSNSTQWQKTAKVGSDGNIYFMISVSNNSNVQADNVNVSISVPSEISSLSNLNIDNESVSGDIVTGINIGPVAPSTTKSITFEGKTQTISETSTKQAIATSNVSGVTQTDSVSIEFIISQDQNQTAAAVSSAPATGGFWGWLRQKYLWILGFLVLIFLFIVVFKRFSSER